MLARPASDPFLAGQDLTRPARFEKLVTRADPTDEIQTLPDPTRGSGQVMTREEPDNFPSAWMYWYYW